MEQEKKRKWPQHLFTGNATAWIKNTALQYCKGDGIDFGAGSWCLPGAIPVDHSTYFGLDDFNPESLDFVYSSHCLEHLTQWTLTLAWLLSKLKPGGYIFLYLPHEDSPWTGWRKHKWTPTLDLVMAELENQGIIMQEWTTEPDEYQSFYVVGRKAIPK